MIVKMQGEIERDLAELYLMLLILPRRNQVAS